MSREETENLYHYTGIEGFEGIISNNSIRMTKSDFLNDPTDCNLFITLIEKYLNKHPRKVSNLISKLEYCRDQVSKLYNKKGCNLIEYIKYIHRHVSLYVMSLTSIHDGMNMWNYYGNGGMELKFSRKDLIRLLKNTLRSEKEFLAEAQVIYAGMDLEIEEIDIPEFSKFVLLNKDSDNVFESHRSFIDNNSRHPSSQLYSVSSLDCYIAIYVKSYILTLEYLLKNKQIHTNMKPDIVFSKVFDNVSNLGDLYYWKHDLSLYMLVLSALIKSDTYEYEREHRIVYFEYNIDKKKEDKEEYAMKHINSGDFLYPYITFESDDMVRKSLKKVTISPVTGNLPINNEMYIETLKKYVSNKLGKNISVDFSEHKIRW